jgi:hypothetical protein
LFFLSFFFLDSAAAAFLALSILFLNVLNDGILDVTYKLIIVVMVDVETMQ